MTESEARGGAEQPPHPPWPTPPATSPPPTPEAAIAVVVAASSNETEACGADAAVGAGKVMVVERRPAEGNGEEAAVPAVEAGACVVIEVGRIGGGADDDGDWEAEKVCRICHLSPDPAEDVLELIQLGCGCKGELEIAHRHCAEAWFKLKGNRYCEICGTIAKNITGEEDSRFMEEWHDRRVLSSRNSSERRGCWRRQPFCNFLMACLSKLPVAPLGTGGKRGYGGSFKGESSGGQVQVWPKGSLEEVVQNAIKTWEMELSHKTRLEDFKTINPDKFKFTVNGRRALSGEETLKLGSYNALLQSSLPEELQYYKAGSETFESSHELFRRTFPRGFAWEVVDVYSGPPVIAFKYRHWGYMEGPYKGHAPTGEKVEFYGMAILKVSPLIPSV
ncbi:hypothetical protein COCNU_14G002290 [Cocos nucifera]|uniref:RING-CH-type domain-containing protein n=1 Tax=Cocos nucifera TaxID=13894 RepID=A0A8K0IUD4_COCNU|nr:hypothetical protein COCNU_14G002290 [Cocos nucifera]